MSNEDEVIEIDENGVVHDPQVRKAEQEADAARRAAEMATFEILSYLQREVNFTRFAAVREIILRKFNTSL